MRLGQLAGLVGKFGQAYVGTKRQNALDAAKQADEAFQQDLATSQLQRLQDQLGLQQQEFGYRQTQDRLAQTQQDQGAKDLADYAANPTPENRAKALRFNKPQDIAQFTPAPKVGLWGAGTPFPDQAAYLAFEKADAEAKRAPEKAPEDHWTQLSNVLGPNGRPVMVNTRTNEQREAPDLTRTGGQGGTGGGGQGQNMQARLLGAVSEGRLADERMTATEKARMKNGHFDIGMLNQATGMTAVAPVHAASGLMGFINNAVQSGSEGYANQNAPDVIQYLRDARLIARAEQLMSARGGSEAQATDNALLARAGNNAPQATVDAAQKSRRALFGKLGAVMQTLTPDQAEKLNRGLQALQSGDDKTDFAAIGREVFGPGGIDGYLAQHGSTITTAERDALKAKGWSDADITAKFTVRQ